MADYRKLLVWQKAHELNLRASRTAKGLRGAQYMSLCSQMVRAAHSIPSNIVEGRGQASDAQFARYLTVAINSASELEYHVLTARDLGAISNSEYESHLVQISEVRRMLHGLLSALKTRGAKTKKLATGS